MILECVRNGLIKYSVLLSTEFQVIVLYLFCQKVVSVSRYL